MDDTTSFEDDQVFEDEDEHNISVLNILSGNGCASGKITKSIDLNADIDDDSDSGEDKLRQSINADTISPTEKK